jgi:hypothetical protein
MWDQEPEVEALQKRLGIKQPVVEVFSNDARLADLSAWDPAVDAASDEGEAATGTDGTTVPAAPARPFAPRRRPGGGGRRRRFL